MEHVLAVLLGALPAIPPQVAFLVSTMAAIFSTLLRIIVMHAQLSCPIALFVLMLVFASLAMMDTSSIQIQVSSILFRYMCPM